MYVQLTVLNIRIDWLFGRPMITLGEQIVRFVWTLTNLLCHYNFLSIKHACTIKCVHINNSQIEYHRIDLQIQVQTFFVLSLFVDCFIVAPIKPHCKRTAYCFFNFCTT